MLASGGRCTREQGVAPGNRAFELQHYHATRLPSGSGVAVGLRQRLPPRAQRAIARAPVQRTSLCTDNPTRRAMRWRGGGRGSQPTAHSEAYHDEGAEREGRGAGMTQRQYKWSQRLTTCEKIIIKIFARSSSVTQNYIIKWSSSSV